MLKQHFLLNFIHQSNLNNDSLTGTKTLLVAQDVPQPSASSQELTRNANVSWGLLVGGGLVLVIGATLYFRSRRRRILRKQSARRQHINGKAHNSRPRSNYRSDRSSGDDYYISSDAYSGSSGDRGCTLMSDDSSLGSSDDTDNSYSSNPSSDTSSSCISDDGSSNYTSDTSSSCISDDGSSNYTSDSSWSSDSSSNYSSDSSWSSDSSSSYTSDSSWSSDSSSSCSSYDSSSSGFGGGESGGGGASENW